MVDVLATVVFSPRKHAPGFLVHVCYGLCHYLVIVGFPGNNKFKIWSVCSNDHASETRIEIMCKKTYCIAQHVFFVLSLISLLILGMMNLGQNVNLKRKECPPEWLASTFLFPFPEPSWTFLDCGCCQIRFLLPFLPYRSLQFPFQEPSHHEMI